MTYGAKRGRSHAWTYTNAKGDDRLAISMSADTARAIAVGDPEAIEEHLGHITDRVERDERTDERT